MEWVQQYQYFQMNDIKNIVKSLQGDGLLLKGVIERIKVEEQEGGFLGMLLGTLHFILLRNKK